MSTTDSPDGPTRVEREILEILERADAKVTPVEDFQAAMRRKQAAARAKVQSTSPNRWTLSWSSELVRIGAALILAILAAWVASFSNFLAITLAIASGVALFSLWFRTGTGGPSGPQRWRGQDLSDPGGPRRPWRWPRGPGT